MQLRSYDFTLLDSTVHIFLPTIIVIQSLVGVKFETIGHMLERLTAFVCVSCENPAISGLGTVRSGEKCHDLGLGERVEHAHQI